MFGKKKNMAEEPKPQPTKESLKDAVINCLRNVYDPEIPVNIYDLKLVYDINIDDDFNLKITMTMTAPNCPEAEFMVAEAKQMCEYIDGIKSVDVELTFDPPWSPDMLSEEIKIELGFDI